MRQHDVTCDKYITLLPEDDDPCGELPVPEFDVKGALASVSCLKKGQRRTAGGDCRRIPAKKAAILKSR